MSEVIKDLWRQQQFRTENASLTVSFRDFVAHCGKSKSCCEAEVVVCAILRLWLRLNRPVACTVLCFIKPSREWFSTNECLQCWIVQILRASFIIITFMPTSIIWSGTWTDTTIMNWKKVSANVFYVQNPFENAKTRRRSLLGRLHNASAFWIYAIIAF